MGSQIAVAQKQSWQLTPTSLEEAMQYAKLIADSDVVPKDFKGKPGNVLIAIQMGDEVGLKPMQSLQSIAVINGRPSIWGDAIPGLCQTSSAYEWHREYYDESKDAAICVVKRKNAPEHTYTFSMKDVVAGGYDKKPGPWQTERRRMMQMRARRAFRDQFPDALKGLSIAEDMIDAIHVEAAVIEQPPKTSQVDSLKDKIKSKTADPVIEGELEPTPPKKEDLTVEIKAFSDKCSSVGMSTAEIAGMKKHIWKQAPTKAELQWVIGAFSEWFDEYIESTKA